MRIEYEIDIGAEPGELGPHVGAVPVPDDLPMASAILVCIGVWGQETRALATEHRKVSFLMIDPP